MYAFPVRLMVCMMYVLLTCLLAGKIEKLARLWHVGTFIGTFARKTRGWHTWHVHTWAHGQVGSLHRLARIARMPRDLANSVRKIQMPVYLIISDVIALLKNSFRDH